MIIYKHLWLQVIILNINNLLKKMGASFIDRNDLLWFLCLMAYQPLWVI